MSHTDENAAPAGPMYDLNSPPRTMTCSSRNSPSQFSPITPDQSNKSEDKEAHDIALLNIDARANQEREKQGDNINTSEFGAEELPKDLACAVSTQLHENHIPDKPDKASNLAIDLNTTPQQKERRRKHRPKVVREGQPKRTRKPACPADTPTGKRKYVRKNKLDKTPCTPTTEATSRTTDMEPAPPTEKLCKRKLNFDSDSQVTEEECSLSRLQSKTNEESSHAQNFYTRVESNEYTRVGIAYEPTYPMTKVVEDCISNQERRTPNLQTPNRIDPLHEHFKGHDQDAPIEGKCQIGFSDEKPDERESIIQGMSYEGEQAKEFERGNPRMSYDAEHNRTNVIGCRYTAMHGYWAMIPADMYNNTGIPSLYFPANYKKKRCEKGQSSSTLSNVTVKENSVGQGIPRCMINACPTCNLENAQFISSSISTKTAPVIGAQGKEQTFECRLALNQKGRISKKRAKGHTPTGMFGSLIELVECRQKPILPVEGVPKMGVMHGYENFNHPPTCMDASMKMKKRTKRNAGSGTSFTEMCVACVCSHRFLFPL